MSKIIMTMTSRGKFIFALISGMLLLSLLCNVIFFSYGKRFYIEHASVRLDPLGLDYYPSTTSNKLANETADSAKQHDRQQTTIVFYGDSRVVSWPKPDLQNTIIFNRGVYSQTSAQVWHRYSAHVSGLHPDIVVLQVGINDLKTLGVFTGYKEALVARCIANIEQLIEQAARDNTTLILSTIFPVGRAPLEKKLFWSDEIAVAVHEVNSYLRTLDKPHVRVFDAYALLVDENGLMRKEFAPDELHLNVAGYAELNRNLRPMLQQLISRPLD